MERASNQDLRGVRAEGEGAAGRKGYRPPELIAWGSVLDLTQGGKGGFDDGDFTGTDPFAAGPPQGPGGPGQPGAPGQSGG